jgi:hypothetical protein
LGARLKPYGIKSKDVRSVPLFCKSFADLPKPGAETKRDRVLTDDELVSVWNACHDLRRLTRDLETLADWLEDHPRPVTAVAHAQSPCKARSQCIWAADVGRGRVSLMRIRPEKLANEGGNDGRSTNAARFLVAASDAASGRRIGAKAVLPGLVHAAFPDHGTGTLTPYRNRPYPTIVNQRTAEQYRQLRDVDCGGMGL